MANLKSPMTPEEVKKAGISEVRIKYNELAVTYNKILENDLLLCPVCNTWQNAETGFYMDKSYATNRFPECKRCILREVEQRKNDKDTPNETKESVQKILRKMNRVYDNSFYNECIKGAMDDVNEKVRHSAFATYITAISSLPQWKNKNWEDSIFGDDIEEDEETINENSRLLKNARKRFGKDYSPSDLIFLETEYEDWTKRYACENKAQELLFKRICFKELEIEKAQKEKRDTKELDKTLQELMGSLQVKPSQSNSNALTEAKTFGQLISKWEESSPVPEPEDEFKDVDRIGLLIDVFFKGHLSKMMGLKNAFSSLYENFMKKYTVNKPQYDEDSDTEALFDQIFGSKIDDE